MNASLRNLILAVLSVAALLPLTGAASAQNYYPWWSRHRHPNTASFNQKVLSYAQSKYGTQDGNGECWTLVDDALRSAGANTSGDSNYVFGTPIATSSVIPGDVIQFTSAKFVHNYPGGGSSWNILGYPNHTAIVSSVQGRQITLLNQNVNNNKTVQYTTINLDDLQSGSMQAYRPK
jgi:hypothetical protein